MANGREPATLSDLTLVGAEASTPTPVWPIRHTETTLAEVVIVIGTPFSNIATHIV